MKSKREKNIKAKETVSTRKGVRLRSLSILMILLAIAVSLLFLDITYSSMSTYNKIKSQNERYVDCQKKANSLQISFTEQRNQLQSFIKTGNIKYLNLYLNHTREASDSIADIETIIRMMRNSSASSSFENVKSMFAELTEKEIYAIALAADAYNIPEEDLPAEIATVSVDIDDSNLTDEEKINEAYHIVSDDEYLGTLNELRNRIGYYLNSIIAFTQEKQTESSDILIGILKKQLILNAVLLLMIIFFNLLTYGLIIRPMLKAHSKLMDNQKLIISGSHEMQVLAERYNSMFDLNEEQQKRLSHKAAHDSLTGLKNRGVFEQLCKSNSHRERGVISMLMIDIDKFKHINDTYGHKTGDEVLCFVAGKMKDAFADIGHICRIGGDEFAIILKSGTEQNRDLVRERVERLFNSLQGSDKSMPNVTLSVGVAFGKQGESGYDVYRRADISLYAAKTNNQECTLEFFSAN